MISFNVFNVQGLVLVLQVRLVIQAGPGPLPGLLSPGREALPVVVLVPVDAVDHGHGFPFQGEGPEPCVPDFAVYKSSLLVLADLRQRSFSQSASPHPGS